MFEILVASKCPLVKNLLGYLAMGRRETGSVIWLHSSSTTTGNLRSFMHGNGQAAQVTPTTRTFIKTRMLLINNYIFKIMYLSKNL